MPWHMAVRSLYLVAAVLSLLRHVRACHLVSSPHHFLQQDLETIATVSYGCNLTVTYGRYFYNYLSTFRREQGNYQKMAKFVDGKKSAHLVSQGWGNVVE